MVRKARQSCADLKTLWLIRVHLELNPFGAAEPLQVSINNDKNILKNDKYLSYDRNTKFIRNEP